MNHTDAEQLRAEISLPAGYECGDILDEDHVRRGPDGIKQIVEHSSFFIHREGGDVFDAFVLHIESRAGWYSFQAFLRAFQEMGK